MEGGAEGDDTKTAHAIQERTYDLLARAVQHIPRQHRPGWYAAIARHYGQPFTSQPTQAENDYHTWSAQRHTPPNAQRNTSA